MGSGTSVGRKRFPTGSPELIQAVERRLGLRLRAGVHWRLLDCAQDLIKSGRAENHAEMTSRMIHASDDDPIVTALRGAASIGETFFFRAPQQLRRLEELAQTHLIKPKRQQGNLNLRVWSVGCATGEEVYTLAILFKRAAPDFNLQILGTDMNEASLQAARVGVYRSRAFRQMTPGQMREFHPVEGGWEVDQKLRSCVSFKPLNLVTDRVPAPEHNLYGFDVVVCRNVLIYLDTDQIPGVMERLGECANATSVLVLTPAEYAAAPHAPGFKGMSSGIFLRSPAPAPLSATDRGPPDPVPLTVHPPASATSHPLARAPREDRLADVAHALRHAREAADYGAFNLAEEHLAKALKLEPDSALPRYLMGAIAMARGDTEAAIREYRQALYLQRGFTAAELGLGLALLRAGKKGGEARRHLERALALLRPLREDAVVEGLEQPALVARGLAAHALEEGR
jgi:chemotaxis protein methyltransferase CheR